MIYDKVAVVEELVNVDGERPAVGLRLTLTAVQVVDKAMFDDLGSAEIVRMITPGMLDTFQRLVYDARAEIEECDIQRAKGMLEGRQ